MKLRNTIWFVLLVLLFHTQVNAITVGEKVLAYYEPAEAYFVGTAVATDNTVKGGGFLIVFDDGDQATVPFARIKKLSITKGSKVLAKFTDGKFYPGVVDKIVGGALFILFDDGDRGWTSFAGIAQKD
jgi:hypothetical protein